MNADEQAIRNLVAQWHRATAAGDVDTVLVRITPLSGGDANGRSGSALSILRERANGSWVLVRDANRLPA